MLVIILNIKAYLNQIEKVQTWSGALELSAFVVAQKQKVYAYEADTGTIHIFNEEANQKQPICLKFHGYGHFEWLQDFCEDEFLNQFRYQVERDGKGHLSKPQFRGGALDGNSPGLSDFGSSSRAGTPKAQAASDLDESVHGPSPKSFCLDDFASSVAPTAGGAPICALQSGPSQTPVAVNPAVSSGANHHNNAAGEEPALCLDDFASIAVPKCSTPPRKVKQRMWGKQSGKRAGFRSVQHSFSSPVSDRSCVESPDISSPAPNGPEPAKPQYWSRGSQFHKGATNPLAWHCPHCPFVIEAATSRAICLARHRHNNSAHQGRFQVGRLKREVSLAPLQPQDPVAWKCPVCSLGLTVDQRKAISAHVFYQIRSQHHKSAHPKVSRPEWLKLNKLPCTTAFRSKRRIHNLNAAISRLKLTPDVPTDHVETFLWPVQWMTRKKVRSIILRRAWRCRHCFRCFGNKTLVPDHVCTSRLDAKFNLDRIATLNKMQDTADTPAGLTREGFHRLIQVAVRALQGKKLDD